MAKHKAPARSLFKLLDVRPGPVQVLNHARFVLVVNIGNNAGMHVVL